MGRKRDAEIIVGDREIALTSLVIEECNHVISGADVIKKIPRLLNVVLKIFSERNIDLGRSSTVASDTNKKDFR